jgi:hypothetical protein
MYTIKVAIISHVIADRAVQKVTIALIAKVYVIVTSAI